MINYFAGLDIFNLSVIGCSIVLGIAVLIGVLMLALRFHVVYFDSEDEKEEIYREKRAWLSRVKVKGANKEGKTFVGWSKQPGGRKPLLKQAFVMLRPVKLYAIWAEAPVSDVAPAKKAEVKKELDYSEGIFVKFNYVDAETNEVVASEGFRLEAVSPNEDVEGWGFAPDGEVLFKKGDENYIFNVNLYPVVAESEEAFVSEESFDGNSVVEITYNRSSLDKVIYKETHYLKLGLSSEYNDNRSFIGWSVAPGGDVVIERGDIDSVFTIPLYSIGDAKAEEVAEEPVVVVEEPVAEEEPVVEEPVVEEVAQEVAEEVVEEVVEAPLYEEIVEEPIAEAEPVIEEPVVEEPVIEEPVIEAEPVVEEPLPEPEPTLVPTYYDNSGNKIDIKYSRSFTANLIQSDDTVKDYYSELKNHIMSYKGVKTRISWKFDSYNRGRDQLFKIKLRGKTICLYCALDPNEFDESRYHHEPIDAKIFEDVPMLVKIKSGLGLRKAKELVDITMAKFGIEKDEKAKTVDYVAKYPYEPNEPLISRKLIKALVADDAVVVVSSKPKEEPKPVVEEPVVEEVAAEEPVVEAEPVIEEVAEEPVVEAEPVIEEVAEEPVVEAEPVIEEVAEEPVVEAEPVIEEVAEEPAMEAPAIEPELVVESVSAEEVHQIVEEKHIEIVVEEGVDYISAKDTKKAIVNIDTLAKNYEAGDDVTIQSLKDKKLIDKRAKSVKVLARGVLNKPLKVRAGEFSGTAAEMILLTGGHAMHVTYKVKK